MQSPELQLLIQSIRGYARVLNFPAIKPRRKKIISTDLTRLLTADASQSYADASKAERLLSSWSLTVSIPEESLKVVHDNVKYL